MAARIADEGIVLAALKALPTKEWTGAEADDDADEGLPTGALIGIIIGALVAVGLVVGFVMKKKGVKVFGISQA